MPRVRRRRGSYPRSRAPLHRRLLLDPRALRRWAVTVAAAVAVTAAVGRTLARAEEVHARWGPTRPVLVTEAAVAAGRPLAGSVRTEEWPVALVADGALGAVADGARAGGDLAAGALVTETDVVAPGTGGRRRLAVPVGDARLALAPGDQVDVWATFDPSLAGGGPTTRRIADAATVAATDGPVVALEVAPGEVAPLAAALATATVTLAATT